MSKDPGKSATLAERAISDLIQVHPDCSGNISFRHSVAKIIQQAIDDSLDYQLKNYYELAEVLKDVKDERQKKTAQIHTLKSLLERAMWCLQLTIYKDTIAKEIEEHLK